jgi:hypothetical protein
MPIGTSYAEPDSSADRNKTHLTQRKKQNMTDHSLTLGSLLLTGSVPDTDHDFTFDVLADGASFGVAQGVREVVRSLLADGDIVRTTRYGNREVSFRVLIEGPSLGSLAHGEAALRAEVGRPNLLTWQAPDALSVPTVFEVVASEMAQTFDDLDELRRRRTFVLTLTCKPFARSADAVTVAALAADPPSPTTVTLSDADTPTGWSANIGPYPVTVTDEGAFVRAAVAGSGASSGSGTLVVALSVSAVSLSATPYVLVEMDRGPGGIRFAMTIDGVTKTVTPILSRTLDAGTTLYALPANGAFSGLQIMASYHSAHEIYVDVHDVTATDTLPQVSPRQQTRIIDVGGTERTPASIRVAAPDGSTNLGLTILHTSPEDGSGYSPPLRRWRTLGNTVTTDTTLLSGAREPLHASAVQFMVPTSALPEGSYELCGRFRASAAGAHRIFFTGFTQLPPPNDGSLLGPLENAETINFPAANQWVYASLGILTLPTVRTTAGMVVINVQRDASVGATIDYDEMWLFRIGEDCALTVEEIPSPNMWADSPGVGSSVPTLWMGSDYATRSNPGTPPKGRGNHILRPEGTAMFAATTGVENPEVSGTFYRLWHSNAAS